MKSSLVAAAAVAMVSLACAKASPVSGLASTSPTDLTGQWQGVCTVLTPVPPAGSVQDPTSSVASITFTPTETTLTVNTYPALGCPVVEYTTTVVSKYVLSGPSTTADADQIDYTIESIKLVFAHASDVGELNDIKLCGYGNWTAGVSQDIAGIDCFSTGTALPAVGASQYDILSVANSQLRFGLSLHDWTTPTGDGAGTSLAKRPTALNATEVYAKVAGH